MNAPEMWKVWIEMIEMAGFMYDRQKADDHVKLDQ
jgi:hypothetical protein